MQKLAITKASELREGQTIKFQFVSGGKKLDGFVTRFAVQIVAYETTCQHIGIHLDYGDNLFFSTDGSHFVCQTHGAMYEPLSGLCVRGPCEGESLRKLRVEVAQGVIRLAGNDPSSAD